MSTDEKRALEDLRDAIEDWATDHIDIVREPEIFAYQMTEFAVSDLLGIEEK